MNRDTWPNFFIVGAAKAGTTSLYAYLREHPQVFMSRVKEPHFFSKVNPLPEQRHIVTSITSESKYLDLFRDANGLKAIGEASPSYLWTKEAPQRIRETIPKARIIILLRDPIDRAYSHYLMDVREGFQRLPFHEAITQDFKKKEKGWGVSHLYIDLGLYYHQVNRYFAVFPREQVLVLKFDNLTRDSRGLLLKVAQFLGIDTLPINHISVERAHNPYASPKNRFVQQVLGSPSIRTVSTIMFPRVLRHWVRDKMLLRRQGKPTLDPRAKSFLQEIYYPDIQNLEKLVGEDLSSLRTVWE